LKVTYHSKRKPLSQRIRDRRDLNALSHLLDPLQAGPYSSAHKEECLPYWMKPNAVNALQGRQRISVGLEAPVRILQDTGHDLWFFVSNRGLEIRSLYHVPECVTSSRICAEKSFIAPFSNSHVLLSEDWIDWGALMPERSISSHQRIQKAKIMRDVSGFADREKEISNVEPVTYLMLQDFTIVIEMHSIKFTVRLRENRATEIDASASDGCQMHSYRHLGTSKMSLQARRMTKLINAMSFYQRLRMLTDRNFFAQGFSTPFPLSELNQNQCRYYS